MPDTKICGHDREALRKALEFANALDLDGISRGWPQPDSTHGALLFDIHDPAKLAAIIAELLRERGVPDLSASEFADVLEVRVRAHGEQIMIARRLPDMHKIGGPLLDMPQARAFALALLDAPNATAQDIEQMIGEVTR